MTLPEPHTREYLDELIASQGMYFQDFCKDPTRHGSYKQVHWLASEIDNHIKATSKDRTLSAGRQRVANRLWNSPTGVINNV